MASIRGSVNDGKCISTGTRYHVAYTFRESILPIVVAFQQIVHKGIPRLEVCAYVAERFPELWKYSCILIG